MRPTRISLSPSGLCWGSKANRPFRVAFSDGKKRTLSTEGLLKALEAGGSPSFTTEARLVFQACAKGAKR